MRVHHAGAALRADFPVRLRARVQRPGHRLHQPAHRLLLRHRLPVEHQPLQARQAPDVRAAAGAVGVVRAAVRLRTRPRF